MYFHKFQNFWIQILATDWGLVAKGLSKSSKLYIFFCNLICVQIGKACIQDHACAC